MCRIAAYYGPPLRLSALLRESSHSLTHQSKAAKEMTDSSVAGDGWGIGWFPDDEGAGPGVLKSILPLWADENAKTATHAIASGSILGHIRFASEGIEVCFTNTPLYPYGDFLYTMNGEMSPWPGPLARAMRAKLDGEDEAGVRGITDAEMLGALWHTCLRRTRGADVAAALREALREARKLARAQLGSIKATLMVSGRAGFWAVRFAEPGPQNTLYTLTGSDRWRGGCVAASEPLDDDPGWQEVPPDSLVRADRHGLHVEPLDLDGKRQARAASA